RHTRSKRDWSSDVCSSDLVAPPMHRDMLDLVAAPIRVFIRRRLAGLHFGEVDQRQLVAITGGRGRGRRTRGRCATAFSRQPHLGLSRRADLAVSLKPIRLLPRLDRLHRANANLPITVGTDNLLHGGMIKVALRLETVTRRHIHEMPVLAIPPTLGPVPAIGPALTLHPF